MIVISALIAEERTINKQTNQGCVATGLYYTSDKTRSFYWLPLTEANIALGTRAGGVKLTSSNSRGGLE